MQNQEALLGMDRIKSYTLVELTVVMLIGSLLVIFLWTGYEFLHTFYIKWNKENQLVGDFVIWDSQFKKDFDQALIVKNENSKLSFQCFDKIIEYDFQNETIIRMEPGRVDSLFCKVVKYEFKYLEDTDVKNNLIQTVDLYVNLKTETLNLIYTKEYDSKHLYNLTAK